MTSDILETLNKIVNDLIDIDNLEKSSYLKNYEKTENIKFDKKEDIINYLKDKRYLCCNIKYIDYQLNNIYKVNLPGYSSKKDKCLRELIKFIKQEEHTYSTNKKIKKTNMKEIKKVKVDYLKKYKQHITNARQRGIRNYLTFQDFKELLNKPCYLCKGLDNIGVDREESSLCYIKDNCKSCCSFCNSIKSSFTNSMFIDRIKLIFTNL